MILLALRRCNGLEDVRFSRDYTDIPDQLITYSEDPLMLKAISNYAKAADLGIEDVQFDVNNREIDNNEFLPFLKICQMN